MKSITFQSRKYYLIRTSVKDVFYEFCTVLFTRLFVTFVPIFNQQIIPVSPHPYTIMKSRCSIAISSMLDIMQVGNDIKFLLTVIKPISELIFTSLVYPKFFFICWMPHTRFIFVVFNKRISSTITYSEFFQPILRY